MTFPTVPPQLEKIDTEPSPFGAQADRHAISWAKERGLLPTVEDEHRLAAIQPGLLAAHCYPSASRAQLGLLADWLSWLFILDDHHDEGPSGWQPDQLEDELTTLLSSVWPDGIQAQATPLGAALADIVQQTGARMPTRWRYRFLRHVATYLAACVQQAAHRAAGEIPDPALFGQLRLDAGAIMPCYDLVEWVEATALPATVYYSPAYQRLLRAAAYVVCWTNDIATVSKEMDHDDHHNLAVVLREADGLSLQEALDEVIARAGMQVDIFLAAEAELQEVLHRRQIPAELQATVWRCVGGLRSWMRGHEQWGRATARYANPARSLAEINDLQAVIPIRNPRA